MKGVLLAFLGTLALLDVTCGKKCEDLIREALHPIVQHTTLRKFHDAVVAFDSNGDDTISQAEFTGGIQSDYPKLSVIAVGLFDDMKGSDDVIRSADIRLFIQSMDTNKDDTITAKEAEDFWTQKLTTLLRAVHPSSAKCTW